MNEDCSEECRSMLNAELADLPLEDLMALRDSVGLKLFAKAALGADDDDEPSSSRRRPAHIPRDNRRRPAELSAKRPVTRFKNVFTNEAVREAPRWDPRFEGAADNVDAAQFKHNYAFLHRLQAREAKELRKELRGADPQRKAEIKAKLLVIKNKESNETEHERLKSQKRELRKANEARLAEGKAPVFQTRKQLREQLAESRFESLKQTGKLEKYMKRKSKKEATKSKRRQPKNANFEPIG